MTKVDPQNQAVREAFSQTLRRIRKERKLSQEELANLIEMHRTEISALERGREPRLETLIKLSAALESPIDELFTDIEWRPLALRPKSEGRASYNVSPPDNSEN